MERASQTPPHVPVLLNPFLGAVAPVRGTWLDGTFGAGGYARALVHAGAERVIGIDQDPQAHQMAAPWIEDCPEIELHHGTFADLDQYGDALDGVVLDLGVSSMQLDEAERGFSFMRDGPLDMRMGQSGPTAADILAHQSEAEIADILFHYGEERASRRIARAIVQARTEAPITSTRQLSELVERCIPRHKPGQNHPATRAFMALRIAVNGEYEALFKGLVAAERALRPGGILAVVTFHSVEDRIVKRFLLSRASKGGGNRYAPDSPATGQFEIVIRKGIRPTDEEIAANPRARSACLRMGRRTSRAAGQVDAKSLGLPYLPQGKG